MRTGYESQDLREKAVAGGAIHGREVLVPLSVHNRELKVRIDVGCAKNVAAYKIASTILFTGSRYSLTA